MNLLELFLKKNSGEIARNRLKLLLVSERAGCSPELLEMIKNDLIRVVSRYMEVDTQGLEIKVTQVDIKEQGGKRPRSLPAYQFVTYRSKGSLS